MSELCFSSQFSDQTVISKNVLWDQTACSNHLTNTKKERKSWAGNKWDGKRERERKRVWWIKCPLLKRSDPTCQLHHSEWSITPHNTLLLSLMLWIFLSFFHHPLTNLHSIPLVQRLETLLLTVVKYLFLRRETTEHGNGCCVDVRPKGHWLRCFSSLSK